MNKDVFIICAVTGSGATQDRSPHVPHSPEQIANSAIDAAKAGAAVVHCYARPGNGCPVAPSGPLSRGYGPQGKKQYLFHVLENEAGTACANVETLLVHVDLATRRGSEPQAEILGGLPQIAKQHSRLAKPPTLGRAIRSIA